jgi:hypothetical protein
MVLPEGGGVADLGNYRLQRTTNPTRSVFTDRRSTFAWGPTLVVTLFVALLGAGGYYWIRRDRAANGTPTARPAASSVAPSNTSRPLGANPEAVDVPPLPESDPLVRLLVQSMSSHPRVLAWMATDGLIRNFTVVVDNIANGQTPAKHLGVLKPGGRFRAVPGAGGLRIDPASYERYNEIAAAVGSVDPQTAARVYATLKPRIEEAHRELGSPEPFDSTLEEAIVRLVQTPLGSDTRVVAKGAEGFQYADGRLESLTDAQKLLLRMGPGNARIVQDKLKQIGLALGIPATRLGS